MSDMNTFERQFEDRVRAFARAGVRPVDSEAVARAVAVGYPRGVRIGSGARWLGFTFDRRAWAVVLALGLLVTLLGGALLVGARLMPSILMDTRVPVRPSQSEPAVVGPIAAPTASPVTSPAGVWIATGSMGTPRSDYTAVRLLDGRVLVAGVSSGGEFDLTSAELYDPKSGTWSATGNMNKPLGGRFPATLLRDGTVLVVGDNGAEVFDPDSGTWTAAGKMVWGGGATATLLHDGTVLVIGNDGSELYDPDRGTWTATGKMTNPRHSHAAILLPDGDVLVAGGHAPGDTPTDSAELYDPDTGAWTAAANMHAPREAIEAFLQPDGKVLVVGGSARRDPQSVELYDPATGSWTATGDLSRPGTFVNASTTLLSDGRVLVGSGAVDADLYDPSTGSWTTAASMLRSHGPPAVLLLDGTVLVAGGSDCLDGVCVATASAELYVPAGVSPPTLPAFPSPPPPVFPSPTPIPTPVPPEAGPVPPNARPWTVTVVNKSSRPATLFVAELDVSGMARLVGSVTPNVVPPGATMQVTFALPAKGVEGWWIFVNPGPNDGPLLGWDQVPLAGEIHIQEGGQPGWLSP
jgi:hypothetical protein